MKYLFLVLIVALFGLIGFYQKRKFINRKNLLCDIREYVEFYDSNLSVFKNDLCQINKQYIIMQNNKNANNEFIYLKNDNLYQFDLEFIKIHLFKINELNLIINYFQSIGSLEYQDEKNKNTEMIRVLNQAIKKAEEEIKTKGELIFKILLSIGAVIAIILW